MDSLPPFVSARFQVYFTPFLRVLFAFPSRYWFTIGHWRVFSLTGWFRQIPTDFHLFRRTQDTRYVALLFRVRDDRPLWSAVPGNSAIVIQSISQVLQPR